MTKEIFKAGEFVFFEGDHESHFYIIESGEVHIITKDKADQQIIVAKLKSGDSFGEFSLIDKIPRTASALAKTDIKVMKISKEAYEMMLNDLPIWASSMLKSLSVRIINMNEILKAMTEAIKLSKY
jgi:CRP/FNR family transcriptional regulator, cyclic AMP receptor protein